MPLLLILIAVVAVILLGESDPNSEFDYDLN